MGQHSDNGMFQKYTEIDMKNFRRLAFSAVALSTVTMLSCIIFAPLSYQYVQRLQSNVLNDMDFCKVVIVVLLNQWVINFEQLTLIRKNFLKNT